MADVSSSPLSFKTRRLARIDHSARHKLRAFETSPAAFISAADDCTDEFYDLTAEDYHRILNTKQTREAAESERRSRMTKAVIRVRFPDHRTLEATFHASDKIMSLVDHVKKVTDRPELPFYLFTTPPKKVIGDLEQDFYSAGFVPGAVVYVSYGVQN